MTSFPFTIISYAFIICYSFIGNGRGGSWVQAADNNCSFRQLSPLSRSRVESANDIPGRGETYLYRTESNRAIKDHVTDSAPTSTPIQAPTAAPSFFTDTQNDRDEHNTWLHQQQQYDENMRHEIQYTEHGSTSTPTSRPSRRSGNGILSTKSLARSSRSFIDGAKVYTERVYRESPTTFWTTALSIAVFLSWNIVPALHSILRQFFLASRQSAKSTWGLSLVLSAVSHNSFRHLLVNLFVFLNLSKALAKIKAPSSSWASKIHLGPAKRQHAGLITPALWPLLVGGALSGNLLFLLFRPRGSCLGLSGSTCAMLGAYASVVPDRVMRMMVYGVVPVSIRTKTLVQVLLVVSLAGAVLLPSSPTCHLGHLGGLLFGIFYYQK